MAAQNNMFIKIKNYPTYKISEENLDTNSNNSNLSNDERDHNTILKDRRDKNKNKNKEKDHDRKWVYNLSSTPLTDTQKKILSRGSNFAILPKIHQSANTLPLLKIPALS